MNTLSMRYFFSFLISILLIFLSCNSIANNIATNEYLVHPNSNTRSETNPVFYFSDTEDDVWCVDHRSDNYEECDWFDIIGLSSTVDSDRIWLNMTMFDYVQEDEKIYYKMRAADAQIILYKGDGEIIYKDGSENFVYHSGKLISAHVDVTRLNFETFTISGNVYLEGQNSSHGDYTISDEIGETQKNENNSLELSYVDPCGDVIISYVETNKVDHQPGLDIITIQIHDLGEQLSITVEFNDDVMDNEGIKYTIAIGDALFTYNNKNAELKYKFETMVSNQIEFSVSGNSMNVLFDVNKLYFSSNNLEVVSFYDVTEQKYYTDEADVRIPEYLDHIGEELDLVVTLFENKAIVMNLSGVLNQTYSRAVRTVIDMMGDDYNGIAEESEFEIFLNEIYKDFSIEDFFEFTPMMDSTLGVGSFRAEFKNALGDVTSSEPVTQTFICSWKFVDITQIKHNLTFQLVSGSDPDYIKTKYIFDIIYSSVKFNFTSEYQYWQFLDNSMFPALLENNLNAELSEFTLSKIEYEIMKNRIHDSKGRFGSLIEYNETLAKGEDKSDNDGAGFLPGFGMGPIIFALIVVFLFSINISRTKRNKNK